MYDADNSLQAEWVAACLSPSDIAPHPNFRAEYAHGAELLALIVRFQIHEYDAYIEHNEGEYEPNETVSPNEPILAAAKQVLQAGTLHEGLKDLAVITGRDDLSFGQRAAAALLVATADSELDAPSSHVSLLADLASTVMESGIGSEGSRSLVAAALLQQCALRKYEVGEIGTARKFAIEVRRVLDRLDESWDDFQVSRGINWSAAETQRRLVELIDGNAFALLVSTGDPLDNSWTELVRSPFPAASTRPTRDALDSLTKVVREVFEKDYSSSRRIRTFGGEDESLRLLYSSLLNSELTGDAAGVRQMRELLGEIFSVRIARGLGDISWIAEAIRLLRQGDAIDHLQRLLQNVREEGPLEVIKEAAEKLIEARKISQYATSADLLLLEKSADLVSASLTRDAFTISDSYVTQERDGRVKGSHTALWKKVETSLKLIDSFIRDNQEIDPSEVVNRVISLSSPLAGGDQFVYKALATLTSGVNWRRASTRDKARWLDLANTMQDGTLAIDRIRAYSAMGMHVSDEMKNELQGLQFVAALVGGLLGDPPSSNDIERAATIVEGTLKQVREEAERGQFTGHAWSPFTLGAILIRNFSRVKLWPAVHALLAHPLVSSDSKTEVLQVLTDQVVPDSLPEDIYKLFHAQPIPKVQLEKNWFLDVPADQYSAVVRNFYLAYDLSDSSAVQSDVLSDISSKDRIVRSEAVQSCFLASGKDSQLEWPVILLLQASYDRDGLVRHKAIRSLAFLSTLRSAALADSIATRVAASLEEPGIASAMGALRGISDARLEAQATEDLWCKEDVARLEIGHPSRNVRKAANYALSLYR